MLYSCLMHAGVMMESQPVARVVKAGNGLKSGGRKFLSPPTPKIRLSTLAGALRLRWGA